MIWISFGIYIIYNIISVYKNKKIPNNLSDTYYIWPKWVFPVVMMLISWTLMPNLLNLTEGSNWQFLSFLTCMGLTFIGLSPDYLDNKLDYKVHSICAYVIALTSILLIILVVHKYLLLLDILIKIIILSLIFTKKYIKDCWLYWLETSLFLSVYLSFI